MGNSKSKSNNSSALVTTTIEQHAVQSQDAIVNTRIDRLIIRDIFLIWLDGNVDNTKSDCQNTLKNLNQTVNNFKIFTDAEQCIQFLETTSEQKICLITSGTFGLNVVPRIHNILRIDSIFIFCGNKKYHEGWTKDWPKIKGVFTEIEPICETLKRTTQLSERNATSISIMNTVGDLSKRNLDQLDLPFVYTQIIKEILLTIHFSTQHIQEFIQHCRNVLINNKDYLKDIDEFEEKYYDQTPIWWYTREFFLYLMLDHALQIMNTPEIVKISFFIADLQRQIEQVHEEQFGINGSKECFTVYRGQGIDKKTFQKMITTIGGLLSFNCFLSTTKDRQLSLQFAQRAMMNSNMIGVLFVMNIDPDRFTTPFAAISKIGYFGEIEDDVIFSMCTVFRIHEITTIDGNDNLAQVELTLINDRDYELRQLRDRIQEESFPEIKGWYRLGSTLRKMGQLVLAQQLYEILLEQDIDIGTRASIYGQLGMMKQDLGEYAKSIEYFEQSIEIEEKRTSHNEQSLSHLYNNIGMVYFRIGDYPKALTFYEKALTLKEQLLSPMHPQLATSYGNIGSVYFSMGDYLKALDAHDKALQIKEKSLSCTHPSLAMSYNNMGNVYFRMGDYNSALASYEKALAIRQQSLPPTHLHLASSYNNIGLVYDSIGDYPKALSSHEQALAIQQNSLSPTHPDLIATYSNMGLVYKNMGNYEKAHSYVELAVNIAQRTLPPNHPDLQKWKNNLADIKDKL